MVSALFHSARVLETLVHHLPREQPRIWLFWYNGGGFFIPIRVSFYVCFGVVGLLNSTLLRVRFLYNDSNQSWLSVDAGLLCQLAIVCVKFLL